MERPAFFKKDNDPEMKKLKSPFKIDLKSLFQITLVGLLFFSGVSVYAQENPPIPIQVKVRTARYLNFGTFTVGISGGTVVVSPEGLRNPTGDVVLLNLGPTVTSALFEVTANPGTLVTISHPSSFVLTGSSGDQILLDNLTYSENQTFITKAASTSINEVMIGGTLNLGTISNNRPGSYSGTVNLTFIQQ